MKNTNRFARLALILLTMASAMTLASVADAQQAYVSTRTTLRAGPDFGYPQVAWLGGGTTVYVNGCVAGYRWCDITSGPVRGWANARHLQYFYNNHRVMIYGNGGRFGLPIVGFALGSYWDNHYRGQSWYNNRDRWNGWRPGAPAPRFDNYAPGHPQYRPHVAPPHAGFAPQQHAPAYQPRPQPYVQPQQQFRHSAPPQAVHQQQQHAPVQQARPQQQPQQQHRQPAGQDRAGDLRQNGSLR